MTMQYFRGEVRGLRGPGLTGEQAADLAAALAPDRPIIETAGFGQLILDANDIYGGGAAVYAPILPQYLRASAMAFAGTLTPTNADAGGRMAGYTKLTITVPNDTLMRVVYNLDANLWVLLPASDIIAYRYITVGLFVSGQSVVNPQSGARWSQPQHLTSKSIVLPRNILAVDGGQIWIPRSYIVPLGQAGFDEVSPSDGSHYFVQSISTNDVVRRHLYDKSTKRGGGTYEAAVRTVDGVAAPLSDQADIAVLATSVNGIVTAPDFQVVGDGGIPPVENQNPYALGSDVDAMPRRYLNTVPTDITSTELRAMGITRGHWDPSSTNSAYVGLDFPVRPEIGQRFFARFYLETTQAGSFGGVQQAYFFYNNGAGFLTEYATFLRQISPTVREYGLWHTVTRDDYESFWIGADASGQTAYRVKVAGLQYHCSDKPGLWVRRNDYPRALNLAYPDTLFASAGRALRFYPRSIAKLRTDQADALFTVSSLKTGGTSDIEFVASGTTDIIIDPDKLGSTGTISARPYASSEVRNSLNLNILVGPKASSGVVRFHTLGDSISYREQPMRVGKSLAARGLTVIAIGTMLCGGGGTNAAPTWGGECREGIQGAAYIYEDMSYANPLPLGQELAYLAMTDEQKRVYNPYIRLAQAGDNLAFVFNEHIFDFRFYLNRFGYADPTHALVQLWRNDVTLRDPTVTMAQMQRAFAVIYSQMRAACPTMQIGFVQAGEARSSGNSTDWSTDHFAMICALMTLIEARRAIGDTRVWFVPAYAHMTAEAGWALSAARATDTDSNMVTSVIDDYVHPIGVARQQLAEVRADWINATAGGTPLVAEVIRNLPTDRDEGAMLPVVEGYNNRSLITIDDLRGGVVMASMIVQPSGDRDRGNAHPIISGNNGRSPLIYDENENAFDIRLNRDARSRIEYHSPTEFLGPHRAFNVRVGNAFRYATVQEADGYVGDVRQRLIGGSTAAIADAGDNVIELIQVQGQSNAGDGSITGRLITGVPAPRHLFKTDGWYSYGDSIIPASPAATDFAGILQPTYGGAQGQLPAALLAIGAYDLDRRDASRRAPPTAVTTNWRGSDPLDSFFPATSSRFNHENVLEQARRARAVARLYGCTLRHDFVFIQGESGAVGEYYTTLNSYLDTVVPIYGGNKGSGDAAYKVFLVQTNSSSTGAAYDAAALAQLRVARERFAAGITTLASVMYDGPLEDQAGADIHGSVLGRMIVHERVALAREFVRRKATAFHPTWPVSGGMTASGNIVTVPISLATGALALAIDTDRVAPVANYGFTWVRPGGGGPTISSVAISGTNIVITLSGPPASGDNLRYALDNSNPLETWAGGRGQIYASTDVTSPFAARGFDVPALIRQPLVRFEETFP